MFKRMSTLIFCFLLIGCATTQAVGSKNWYKERLAELDMALEEGEVTKEKYLELKTQADQIRNDYIKRRQRYYHYGHYYGYPRHHGFYYGYRYRHYH